MSQRYRRNFIRRSVRHAYFRARRRGEHYCGACGVYRAPTEFTGADRRTCDHCRGTRQCRRCGRDQPIADFDVSAGAHVGRDVCGSCRRYRALTPDERAAFSAFLAAGEDPKPAPGSVSLGRDAYGQAVRLAPATRRRHFYLIGKNGSGKETLIENVLVQDMLAGRGCALIDLEGDLALDLLGAVPPARLPVVTYFAPATGHGPAFNPLAQPYPPHEIAEDVVEALKTFFAGDLEPELENLLRFGLLTLLGDRAPHTLADLYQFFVAPTYRSAIADASPSPRLRAFWRHEIGSLGEGMTDRIARMLARFLTPLSPAERLFSTRDHGLSFEALIAGRQIFIANLSSDRVGREAARLIGALLMRAVARAAQAGAARTPHELPDFALAVPHFAAYAAPGCGRDLTRLAEVGVSLTCADRSLAELPARVADEIVANVGVLAAFEVSGEDAGRLRREMVTRRLCRVSTGAPYDHDAARRAAAAPGRAAMQALLAAPVAFPGEDQPSYEAQRIDALMAEIERVPRPPDDLGEIEWPRDTDLTQPQPMVACVCIRDRSGAVALTVDPPPAVDDQIRASILDRPRRREHQAHAPGGAHMVRQGRPRRRTWRGTFRALRRRAR